MIALNSICNLVLELDIVAFTLFKVDLILVPLNQISVLKNLQTENANVEPDA